MRLPKFPISKPGAGPSFATIVKALGLPGASACTLSVVGVSAVLSAAVLCCRSSRGRRRMNSGSRRGVKAFDNGEADVRISVHYKLGEKAMVIQNYWLASTPPKVGQTKSDFG